ncbi:MAG: SPASM domain-containing protein [Selenomonadaceae bacterium]|nr:SPASM domain-containing protein [Selenomonadaceae bacterium]
MDTAYMNEKFAYYHNLWEERKRDGVRRFLEGAPLSACISRVSLALSNMCNLADIHKKCPASTAGAKQIMKRKNIEKVVKDLQKVNFKGTIAFHLYNEPTNDPRLFDIAKYVKANLPGAEIFLYTNGFYLCQDMCDELEEIVDCITVTAYGKKELERLIKLKVSCGFYTFLGNLDDRLIQYDGESKDTLSKTPCRTFFDQIAVFPNGDIGLCCRDSKHEYSLENVFQGRKSFNNVIDSSKFRKFQTELLSGNREICDLCKNCELIL